MAEELIISKNLDKKSKYDSLIPQIEALTFGETDLIANLSNISGALKEGMGFFWIGFYIVKEEELVLGPFQGSIACTRIKKGKGVCGKAWIDEATVIADNVDDFPGHISCNSESKSEIVLPAFKNGKVSLVLDVDSNHIKDFDDVDQQGLQRVIDLIEKML